jgi:hypothetical protein
MKSAQYAGYIDSSTGRLIKPGNGLESPKEEKLPADEKDQKRSGGGEPPDLHPFIQGLLKELPVAGSAWPDAKRKLWLDTAASIFKIIYKDDETTN